MSKTSKLKRRKVNKDMSIAQKIKVKWQNEYLQRIGYFEPVISLRKLFGDK